MNWYWGTALVWGLLWAVILWYNAEQYKRSFEERRRREYAGTTIGSAFMFVVTPLWPLGLFGLAFIIGRNTGRQVKKALEERRRGPDV